MTQSESYLAQKSYEAFIGKTNGAVIPFGELSDDMKQAWVVAAIAAIEVWESNHLCPSGDNYCGGY